LMVGSITARTLDYFGWLVVASVGALLSAVVTAICVKYEARGPCGASSWPASMPMTALSLRSSAVPAACAVLFAELRPGTIRPVNGTL
jgi:hypothetical protein